MTSASQQPEAIGLHTHQLHGIVKSAPSSGSTTFVVTTERYGDVTVSFAGARSNGHGHSHGSGVARAFEAAIAAEVKADERVIVQGNTSGASTFNARRVRAATGVVVLPA